MGYEKVPVIFHPIPNHPLNQSQISAENSAPFQVTMYYGSKENEHFIGDAPLEIIAQQIYQCVGPSGANKEYLYNLCSAMREIYQGLPDNPNEKEMSSVFDTHLKQLESMVKAKDLK